jgi:hypothetical protein
MLHVAFSQDTVCELAIKPLLPSFAQNTPGSVIDEQSKGDAALQHVFPSAKGLHVAVEHELWSGLAINPLFPFLLQKEEGFDIDRHVAALAAGLQQRNASFAMKHVDDKQCSDSGSSIKPFRPWLAQNTFGAVIDEHIIGGAG